MIHCLHGAVGSTHDWNLFQDSLSEEVHAIDLWKLLKKGVISLPAAGQLIAQQAKQNDVLLGYSMGGRLALHTLLADPDKWRAAIIISAHPGLCEGHADRLRQDEKWATLAEQDWDLFLKEWNQQTILAAPSPGLHQAMPANQSSVATSFRCWSLGAQEDLSARLTGITCPLLWLSGAHDHKFTRLAREATAKIPASQHLVIPEAGHRTPWEQPAAFASAVRDFLATCP